MPTPRADFACRAPKCKTPEGAAPVYELPVGATRCPVCGSKRIMRVWTPPHVSQGKAKKIDGMLGPEYQRQRTKKDAAKKYETEVRRADQWSRFGLRAGLASQLGQLAASATGMQGFQGYQAGSPVKSAKAEGSMLGRPNPSPKGLTISGRRLPTEVVGRA